MGTTILPFQNNVVQTYVYEPFSFTISNRSPGTSTLTTTTTSGIPPGYATTSANDVVFAASSNAMNTGREEYIITETTGGVVTGVSSNIVVINSGRFLDASGTGYGGRSFTFFKNEPITPLPLIAPFEISEPISVPTLPPGLSYVSNASNQYTITGTPLVTVPQSNYLVIGRATGSNLGKIVTTLEASRSLGIVISNERVRLTLDGEPIVSSMLVGTAIAPRTLTAQFPPYPSGGTLRYTWSGLPDGIYVTDNDGVPRTSPFSPNPVFDPASSLIVQGTPTLKAAEDFRDAGITSAVVTFTASRTSPLPVISNSVSLTFQFGQTVLFDAVTVPFLYQDVALDPSAISFRAQTYFDLVGGGIASMVAPSLPDGLSLSFTPGTGRGFLTGTPTTASAETTYAIQATNSNGTSRTLDVPMTVVTDTVNFESPTPAEDTPFAFVLSRPLTLALTGFYSSPIEFQASSASRRPVTFSTSSFDGTGLSLVSVTSNRVRLVGTPEALRSVGPATITASAVGSPATASRTVLVSIEADVITISDVSTLSFIQNRTITPVQFTATTLSTRPITSFSSSSLPPGLSLSTTGLLSGRPSTSTASPQTFSVTASTGFASQSRSYSYSIIPDNLLVVLPGGTATVGTVFSNVIIDTVTYSGVEGSLTTSLGPDGLVPYQSPSATLTITPPKFLSGDFSGARSLASEYRFQVTGQAGSLTQGTQATFAVSNRGIRHLALNATARQPPVLVFGSSSTRPTLSWRLESSVNEPVTFPTLFGYVPVATGPSTVTSRLQFSTIDGNGMDMAISSTTAVIVAGSTIYRSTDSDGVVWTAADVTFPSDVFGPQWGLGQNDPPTSGAPSFPRQRFATPILSSVATDGGSNWWAIGSGTTGSTATTWTPVSLVVSSSNNALTWTSTQTTIPISSIDAFYDKLTYNQGRLIATRRNSDLTTTPIVFDLSGLFYADVSSVGTWTRPETPFNQIAGVAASNATLVALAPVDGSPGTPGPTAGTMVSTTNGTTWSEGTNAITSNLTTTRFTDIVYSAGKWVATGVSEGFSVLRWSSNLTSWSDLGDPGNQTLFNVPITTATDNGLSWVMPTTTSLWGASLYTSNGSLALATLLTVNGGSFAGYVKRLLSSPIDKGTPMFTLSFPYDPTALTFVSPVQTQYTNYQYATIPTIPIEAVPTIPGSFVYYYATGLPRGLTLTLDASGILASIGGTSVQFNEAFQPVIVYAALDPADGGGVSAYSLSMRTILPTVTRIQTSAGAWTSLTRQYTIVNAAQNSVNGKTLPSTQPPLGEFTRPHPPDSVSATGDPNCVRKCD